MSTYAPSGTSCFFLGVAALMVLPVGICRDTCSAHQERLFDQAGAAYGKVTSTTPPALPFRLEIPRLQCLYVLDGTDPSTLRLGAGHIPGTALPGQSGNVGIAAHRDTFFRSLRGIRRGDVVHIETSSEAYEYRVDSTAIVNPSDVWVLKPRGTPMLTLVTCYPFEFVGHSPQRFVIWAVEQPPASSATEQPPPPVRSNRPQLPGAASTLPARF